MKTIVRHPFGIFKPLWFEPAKHIFKFFTDYTYRSLCIITARHGRKDRYKEFEISFNGWKIKIPDSLSFFNSFNEIFIGKIYNFKADSNKPVIMDVGANIGLSVLNFKSIYPDSTIIAIEPDPKIFKYLQVNIKGNGYTDVQLINKAAWINDDCITFQSEGSDAGKILKNQVEGSITIDAVRLKSLIEQYKPEFLKIDIEGAEEEVLIDCKDRLNVIKWLFVEYHSKINSRQKLDQLLEIILRRDFRIQVSPVFCNKSPFIENKTQYGYDMQLNIFAWR